MNDEPLGPLPDDVRKLLDAERPIPAAPPQLAAHVLTAVTKKLASGAAAPAVVSGAAAKVVIAVLAFGAGAGAMHAVDAAQQTVLVLPAPVVAPPAPRPAPPAHDDLGEEQALIEQGRAALMRGNAAEALAPLEEHERRFPSGQLSEDREALRVQALVASGHADEALTRAERFRVRWPHSILSPVVDAAVSKKE